MFLPPFGAPFNLSEREDHKIGKKFWVRGYQELYPLLPQGNSLYDLNYSQKLLIIPR
jgi:hypothetical protein